MKKTILALLLALCMGLAGCASQTMISEDDLTKGLDASMFVQIERTLLWSVVYHKDTRVMYAFGNPGIFTLLVDADGQPLLWEGGK